MSGARPWQTCPGRTATTPTTGSGRPAKTSPNFGRLYGYRPLLADFGSQAELTRPGGPNAAYVSAGQFGEVLAGEFVTRTDTRVEDTRQVDRLNPLPQAGVLVEWSRNAFGKLRRGRNGAEIGDKPIPLLRRQVPEGIRRGRTSHTSVRQERRGHGSPGREPAPGLRRLRMGILRPDRLSGAAKSAGKSISDGKSAVKNTVSGWFS